jgi:hypothetical protein
MRILGKKAALPVIALALAASATGCVADKARLDRRNPAKPKRLTITTKQEPRTAISSGHRLENRQTESNAET